MLAAMALAYVCCYVAYILWPTEGPSYALPAAAPFGGPLTALVLTLQRSVGVHGNAFPSAHAAMGSVAVLYLSRRSPLGALVLTGLVTLMCVGAVYLQYHYASDMFAGLLLGALAAFAVELFSGAKAPYKEVAP
jgi:membrane-associated phospholipid phosphatase